MNAKYRFWNGIWVERPPSADRIDRQLLDSIGVLPSPLLSSSPAGAVDFELLIGRAEVRS